MTFPNRLSWLWLLLLLPPESVLAQKNAAQQPTPYQQLVRTMRTPPASGCIIHLTGRDEFKSVPAPAAFLRARQNRNARVTATSQFIVTYTGFTPEAQAAFQYAVDIWQSLLASPVPIRINATWSKLDPGVLGSASPADFRLASDGTQKAEGYYPIGLAEKIARRDLNSPDSADIVANFSNNANWSYSTDGTRQAGKVDLASVVLHELGHGLGFFGFFDVSNGLGSYSAGYPSVFDHFIENRVGQRLVSAATTFPDNSTALAQQLTGNNLFLNGPILRRQTGGRAKLYTPSSFNSGSSVYHLDETTYPPGDINSLMTPALGNAEVIHTPGPIVLGLFADLEWKTTSVLHTPIPDSEDIHDLAFTVRVVSDTTLVPNSVRFFYRRGAPTVTDTTFVSVTPTPVAGASGTYTYVLPAAQAQGDIWYYFSAQDASGRTFTNPGKSRTGGQLLNRVRIGPDNVPPLIRFTPPADKILVFNTTVANTLPVQAYVADDRPNNVDTAYVEYRINGVAQPSLPLRYTPRTAANGFLSDSIYANQIIFPANTLKPGDVVTYRIVARDASRAKNVAYSPATGYYPLTVVQTLPAQSQYVNDFNDAGTNGDFVGYGFSITTPAGFTNPAIHSTHPYQDGSDYKYETNYEYLLRAPIRLAATAGNAVMQYDEIVLVEPGEPGAAFGTPNFYDYVVVEGSRDNGQTWLPIFDGYDSNAQPDWLSAYNRNLVRDQTTGANNSTTVGTPALYKTRKDVSLIRAGGFQAGETILLRFRLFADQLSHGWGWTIDNLRIQSPILATEPVRTARFAVYPNPVSNGLVRIDAELPNPIAQADVSVTGPTGQVLRRHTFRVGGTTISESLDLTSLPAGLYFLQLRAGDTLLTKKLVIGK